MTSYFSSFLTTTSSRVAAIRQNLLASEDDGATEDDTHLCRVLRAHYTEKGRQFPAWLPPDPKAPPPVVVQPVYSTPGVGARYGGGMQGQQQGGLSSLWDKSAGSAPQQQQQPGSLRQGRAPQNSPFQRQEVQARPLPSQREGSYQATSPFGRESPAAGAGSASNRLKDRFRPGAPRTGSPTNGVSAPPPTQRSNSYETGGSGGAQKNSQPFVASNSPWSNNEREFNGGGYGGGPAKPVGLPGGPARPVGLPNGPGAGRRGPGLPSGPRGMR